MLALFSVSASWGSCVSGKKTINLSTVLGIPSINFSYQRSKLKLTRVHRHFRSSSFGNACTFFRFSKLGQMRFWKKTINLSTVLGIPSSYFSNQRLKLKITIGTMNSSFGNACSFFRFSKLGQLRFWKKTINLSTVLGIPSINFSNQRSKLKLTRVHRHFRSSSFGNACTFFRFSKLGQLRFWKKKTINLSTVLGIPSSYFSNQRLKLKLTIGTMNSSFGNAWCFFRFSKLGQLRFWKKTINISTVLGIPSINFSIQRSKLKLTRVHRHFRSSSFGNACTFFRFSKLGQLRFWKKNNYSIHRSRNTFNKLFLSKIKVEINHSPHALQKLQFRECLHFFPFQQVGAVAFLEKKQLFYPPF